LERDSKCLRPGYVRPKTNIDFSQLKFSKNRQIIFKKTDIKLISSLSESSSSSFDLSDDGCSNYLKQRLKNYKLERSQKKQKI